MKPSIKGTYQITRNENDTYTLMVSVDHPQSPGVGFGEDRITLEYAIADFRDVLNNVALGRLLMDTDEPE